MSLLASVTYTIWIYVCCEEGPAFGAAGSGPVSLQGGYYMCGACRENCVRCASVYSNEDLLRYVS